MKTKICGITNLDDARLCIEAGADMLGFNFYPKSPRSIAPEACASILSSILDRKSSILVVGVFVNAPPAEVLETMALCNLDLAQLSGDEPPSDLAALDGRGFKALRPRDPASAAQALASLPARSAPPACLVDACRPGEYGGTGQMADWNLAAGLARHASLLLAGGLTPGNVAAAVRQVQPWGVDVASGVEAAPGKKDPEKVRQFIVNARHAIRREIVPVERAAREDLPEILALQKLAYRSEAELNNDFDIPPLTQTRAEIEAEFEQRTFLKMTLDRRIVGSVRAHLDAAGACHIGRLIVHPDHQNRGLGTQLMAAIEAHFDRARRYELFTGQRSVRNLYLYHKLGYREFRRQRLDDTVCLVYLEKTR